jgi:hypothetical protein
MTGLFRRRQQIAIRVHCRITRIETGLRRIGGVQRLDLDRRGPALKYCTTRRMQEKGGRESQHADRHPQPQPANVMTWWGRGDHRTGGLVFDPFANVRLVTG